MIDDMYHDIVAGVLTSSLQRTRGETMKYRIAYTDLECKPQTITVDADSVTVLDSGGLALYRQQEDTYHTPYLVAAFADGEWQNITLHDAVVEPELVSEAFQQ